MITMKQYGSLAHQAYTQWQVMQDHANNTVTQKNDGSLITKLDIDLSNTFLDWQANLLPHFKGIIIDEEDTNQRPFEQLETTSSVLLHDPVDWTTNLTRNGSRHTLANLCYIRHHQGRWNPLFAGMVVPAKQEVWWVDGAGVHAKKLGFNGWLNEPELNLNLPAPEERYRDTIALDVAVKKDPNLTVEDHYRVIYGASVDSMLTAITHPVYALVFQFKPWDLVFYPALLAQGFLAYTLSNGMRTNPFDPANFIDEKTGEWCNAQDKLVFLPETEKNPADYIAELRQHLNA